MIDIVQQSFRLASKAGLTRSTMIVVPQLRTNKNVLTSDLASLNTARIARPHVLHFGAFSAIELTKAHLQRDPDCLFVAIDPESACQSRAPGSHRSRY